MLVKITKIIIRYFSKIFSTSFMITIKSAADFLTSENLEQITLFVRVVSVFHTKKLA